MKKGLIWVAVGIGIIAYNHMSTGSMLVLRGTNIDFGYIAVAVGVVTMAGTMLRKEKKAS